LTIFAALAALCLGLGNNVITELAVERCLDVGASTGCAGCNAATTGCEWCWYPKDHALLPSEEWSACAPKGHCDIFFGPNGEPFERALNTLCPAPDVAHERMLREPKSDILDELVFSPSFAPHYCGFSRDSWTVDRFANVVGSRDPETICELFNTKLYLGQRGDIEDNCRVDLSVPKVQACLALFHSFQCSAGCPEYGVPARFNKLCASECRTLRQFCDFEISQGSSKRTNLGIRTLYDCLVEIASDSGGILYECVDEGDNDCDKLPRIPASGQFEHDYCFWGDQSRCTHSHDCQLKDKTNNWGVFANNCECCGPPGLGDGREGSSLIYDGSFNYVGFPAGTQRDSDCQEDTDYSHGIPPPPVCVAASGSCNFIAMAFEIVAPDTGGNTRSCEEVAQDRIDARYFYPTRNVDCDYESGVCVGVAIQCGTLDASCADPAQAVGYCLVPNEINCLWEACF